MSPRPEIGAAQPDLAHDSLGHRELPNLIGAASVKRRRAAGKAREWSATDNDQHGTYAMAFR
jgi:hypothetical protein